MNALQMTAIQPIKFACDSIPDCQGQITERIGNFVIIEGMAQDSGAWFAKGVGGARRFQTRQEAADYIEYAMDAKDGGPGSGPQEGGGEGAQPKKKKEPTREEKLERAWQRNLNTPAKSSNKPPVGHKYQGPQASSLGVHGTGTQMRKGSSRK